MWKSQLSDLCWNKFTQKAKCNFNMKLFSLFSAAALSASIPRGPPEDGTIICFFQCKSKLLRHAEKRRRVNSHTGGWSLWRPFSFNLPYRGRFLNFWSRMTLDNELDKNIFCQTCENIFHLSCPKSLILRSRWMKAHIIGKIFVTFWDL